MEERRLKICMVAPHMNFMVNGGANTQLQKTAHFLKEQGIEVEFFDPCKKYDNNSIDLFHMFTANISTLDLARKLNDFDIKYVVSPIFYTLHGPMFLKITDIIENIIKKVFNGIWTDYGVVKQICNSSAAVLPNTTAEAGLIENGLKVSGNKIHVIPNGVDERFYNADPSLFYETYGTKDFLLYTGVIGSVRKNTLSLIRAVKNIDHPVVIIGKIHKNKYSEQCLEEASKNKNILFIDALEHDSPMLESAYAACHTFVLPSYFETPGISALEAGLTGANIVITEHGGTKDYFADYAVYIEPSSVKSIKKGIEKALNSLKQNKLKQRIKENYFWPQIAKKTADLYKSIIDK